MYFLSEVFKINPGWEFVQYKNVKQFFGQYFEGHYLNFKRSEKTDKKL
jgi:hypothetical protein